MNRPPNTTQALLLTAALLTTACTLPVDEQVWVVGSSQMTDCNYPAYERGQVVRVFEDAGRILADAGSGDVPCVSQSQDAMVCRSSEPSWDYSVGPEGIEVTCELELSLVRDRTSDAATSLDRGVQHAFFYATLAVVAPILIPVIESLS